MGTSTHPLKHIKPGTGAGFGLHPAQPLLAGYVLSPSGFGKETANSLCLSFRSLLLWLSIVMFITAPSFAQSAEAEQKSWTLADCIGYAVEHNITVRQNAINAQQREIELESAKARMLPGVSAGASQSYSFGRGLTSDNTYANTNTTNTSLYLGADVTLFQGFAIRNNIELSRLNLEAATEDLEKAKNDIRIAVAQAYVQSLYNMEIAAVARSQVEVDSLQVERLRALAENGKAVRADVSVQEATLAQSRLTETQALNNVRMAILDLTQLLELPTPEGFAVVPPSAENLTGMVLPLPDEIYAEAVETKPEVRGERIRLDAAGKNIDIAKAGYYPSLSLSTGLGSNYYTMSSMASPDFSTQMRGNFSPSIGLSLSIPLFDRFSTRNSVRAARLSRQMQELQLENVSKGLYKEIQQAYYNAVAAESKYKGSLAAEKSARDAFEVMSAKYEADKANITEFNESKNRLMSASSDLAQARYQYLYQSRLLDFYRGKDMVF